MVNYILNLSSDLIKKTCFSKFVKRSSLFIFLSLIFSLNAFSQKEIHGEQHVAIEHDAINIKQLEEIEKLHPRIEEEKKVPNQYGEEGEDENEEESGVPRYRTIPPGSVIYKEASGSQNRLIPQANQTLSPVPNTNFNGLDDNNSSIPPDVNGAVGPNHLMVTLNSEYRIQSRAGATISTISMSSFWGSLTGVIGTFDPKTLYDPYNARWITVAVSNSRSASSSLLVAVSQTSDPTGSWNRYKIDATPADTMWLDYPSIGFTKDWIVITGNMFGNVGGGFQAAQVYVLNKSNFYAGGAGQYTSINAGNNVFTLAPAVTYDNSISTMYLVQTWDGSTGNLQLYTITGAIGSEVLTPGSFPGTANTWAYGEPMGNDFAPQSTVVNKFQCNDDRILNCVYRNGAIWCVHTIFLPLAAPTRCSLQWWKLTAAGAVTARDRIDDPSGTNFYAFPSLSVNSSNDALIGYAKFSATTFASAGYSLKLSTDANFQSDYIFKAGLAKYFKTFSGTRNRWGDYTMTQVDPTNDNDFWTLGEYASTPNSGDRWGTWWANVTTANTPPIANFIADRTTACTNSNVTFTSTSSGTIASYSWNFGTGATPATSTSAGPVVVQYSTTGLKTISLTVTGLLGSNSITKTNYINIIAPPGAAGVISGSATVCPGQNGFAYSVASISGATGYTWTLPAGATIASGTNTNSITVNFSSSAVSGTISVYGTNSACSGSPSSLSVTVGTSPSKTGALSFTGTSITIKDGTTATPYPASINVSGFLGNMLDVNVILTGLSHTWKGDIDILLESPTGQKMILMSDCGEVASSSATVSLTLNDSAISNFPPASSIFTGSYKPTNYGSPDIFPSPGPGTADAPPYTSLLSTFNGFNPNGSWKLYVVDDGTGDVGSITSWSLTIIGPVPNNAPVITGSASVCRGQNNVAYSIPPVTNVTGYNWSLPSGATIASGANTNSITVNFSGSAVSGNITVTPFNNCGNSTASTPFSVTVNPSVTANVTITPAPPGPICSGTNVTFTATPTNGGSTPVYQWKKNGSVVGTNSTTYSSNSFFHGDQVTCTMTSNANCVTGSPVTSAIATITVNVCNLSLNLKIFIEGFYSEGRMRPVLYDDNVSSDTAASDSITVELHSATAPYDLVYSKNGLITTTGNGNFIFPAVAQAPYYIAIRHRNSIETWSKDPVSFISSPVGFDFTSP